MLCEKVQHQLPAYSAFPASRQNKQRFKGVAASGRKAHGDFVIVGDEHLRCQGNPPRKKPGFSGAFVTVPT